MNQKGFANIILVLAAIIIVGVIGYFAVVKLPITQLPTTDFPGLSDWKTYRDDKFGFEIKYPPNWVYTKPKISEESANDFSTVTFGLSANPAEQLLQIDVSSKLATLQKLMDRTQGLPKEWLETTVDGEPAKNMVFDIYKKLKTSRQGAANEPSPLLLTVVAKANYGYYITVHDNDTTAKKMISTFKFIR